LYRLQNNNAALGVPPESGAGGHLGAIGNNRRLGLGLLEYWRVVVADDSPDCSFKVRGGVRDSQLL
jgi:hypothetical protein